MKNIALLFLFVFSLISAKSQTDNDAQLLTNHNRYFNDVARFFAGLPQEAGSSIVGLDTNKVWLNHKKSFGEFFARVEKDRIPKMKNFAQNELSGMNDSIKTLFYPFSGPDFVHANIFFPKVQNIIMLGLERVGVVPKVEELNDKKLGTFFKAEQQALDSIFIWGYFMTNDMNKDFTRNLELRGVVPIFMIFMAKADFQVLDVQKGTIDGIGNWIALAPDKKDTDTPNDTYISGVLFRYVKKGETKVRRLYYFSHDVSDQHLKKTPQFEKFVAIQKPDATFLKAASYLIWHFGTIRKLALATSNYVFQDDSGIEFRYFDNKDWTHRLYGKYTRTIGAFRGCVQPKLKTAYATEKNVKPLDFGIGYGFRIKESNFMLFKRKINN